MDNKDLLKELESLKKRVSELESQKQDNLSMFGRSYNQTGNLNSDFLIKTKGQIKVQFGGKFIDLIKDGKINVDASFIFTVKSQDKIGVKDGIYLTDDGLVYLKVGENLINLVGEIGNTYVSFLGEQETQADSKYTALRNIGFLYPDINSFGEDSLQNGIIYIEAEQKLYIVQNGQLSEFSIAFPNPFTEQFIIQKNDANNGALLIKGSGITNSLAFDSFYIFTEEGNTYLRSDGEINIMIDEDTFINVTQSKTTIKNIVEANTFQSIDASYDSGFMLYIDDNGSTLIVDNLIVRNQSDEVSTGIYPVQWSLKHNVITSVDQVSDPTLESCFALSLKYKNEYKVGDYIYFYGDVEVNDFSSQVIRIPAQVRMLNTETGNIIYVEVLTNLIENVGSLQELPNCIGKITYLVGSEEKLHLLRYAEQQIDLVECQTVEEEQSSDSIQARYGLLDDLNLKERDNVTQTEPEIKGQGIYSGQGYFSKAGYEKDYGLLDDDDSTQLASTEWVRKLLKRIIPKGTITAYHGDSIPDGWALCDGENGTPNLIGKFIKAGETEQEGGQDEVLLKATDIPLLVTDTSTSSTPGSFAGKLIPTLNKLEEFVVDKGGSSNYCLYTGSSKGDNGLTPLPVESLSSVLNVSSTAGTDPANQTSIKIEPKYYQLVFIMKIE